VIQGVGFVVWVVVISRIKLGLAFALAGAFLYILMALVSWQLYGERLAPLQWVGIVLVSAGVLMISMLGPQT
jgi:multidrug transporter EmrE-like cation transporter